MLTVLTFRLAPVGKTAPLAPGVGFGLERTSDEGFLLLETLL